MFNERKVAISSSDILLSIRELFHIRRLRETTILQESIKFAFFQAVRQLSERQSS